MPEVREAQDRFAFSVPDRGRDKGFAWVWMERTEPKKARVPQPAVLAVRVADLAEKESLLASDAEKFFTEAHYNRFPAVLVRLARIEPDELAELIIDAWRCQAPRSLVRQYDAGLADQPPGG
nr:MmcQ/YjbR family DNA-binding protein [Microlunatus panaciterrae]